MDATKLVTVVTVILTLSIASERLVEIIKGFVTYLNAPPSPPADDPESLRAEARRKTIVSLLSVACGVLTALIASPILAGIFKDLFAGTTCKFAIGFLNLGESAPCGFDLTGNGILIVFALGLLASGGSSLWNSVLEYFVKIKDLKKVQVQRKDAMRRIEVERANLALEAERSRKKFE